MKEFFLTEGIEDRRRQIFHDLEKVEIDLLRGKVHKFSSRMDRSVWSQMCWHTPGTPVFGRLS